MKKIAALLCSLMMFPLIGLAKTGTDGDYMQGVEYEIINPAQPTETGNKVEVVELFWYGCPHCYRFEPHLAKWLKNIPPNASFRRMPAIFRSSWDIHARAFYTAEALGVVDKIHSPLFHAMHSERKKMNTKEALREFFGKYGVKAKDFDDTFDSFSINAKVQRSRVMSRRYGIQGVPSVVVNGKYRVNGTSAGGNQNIMKVVDYLIQKETSSKRK